MAPRVQCSFCGGSGRSKSTCTACGVVAGDSWEADIKKDEYAGTFRWSQKRDFMPLPPYTSPPCLDSGWNEYLQTRFSDAPDHKVVIDVALLDGLSFPMSFIFALRNLMETQPEVKDAIYTGVRKLAIIAVGCAQRAEEHVLHHTNYWSEISNLMPSFQLQLWLVGPEMSEAAHLTTRRLAPRMEAGCFRGTFAEFQKDKLPAVKGDGKLIVIGYNTGMASGDDRLKASWKADIMQLLEQRVLCIFTCANDHNDVKCEKVLMDSLGARYMLTSRKNMFAAVTTLHPPGQKDLWYSANAFVYAVQGFTAKHERSKGACRAIDPTTIVGGGQHKPAVANSIVKEPKTLPNSLHPLNEAVASMSLGVEKAGAEASDLYLPD